MNALQNASPQEKAYVENMLMDLQMTESMSVFNTMSKTCFTQCCTAFRARTLDASEKQCIKTCAEKYSAYLQRSTQRFGEVNAAQQQQQMAQQQ